MKGIYGIKGETRFFYLPLKLASFSRKKFNGDGKTKISYGKRTMKNLVNLIERGELSKDKLEESDWCIYKVDIPDCLVEQFSVYQNTDDLRTFDCAYEILDYAEYILGLDDSEDNWWRHGEEFPEYIPGEADETWE
ncbi:MAG: hypothetical protein Q8N99_03275 [Nanoarchaeota archaeon]|nr:hypothetical protein [Nanoarchaeota archaeon]